MHPMDEGMDIRLAHRGTTPWSRSRPTISFAEIEPGEYVLNVWQPDRRESALPLRLAAGEVRHLRLR